MKKLGLSLAAFGLLLSAASAGAAGGFQHFITARDGRLFEGEKPFRFISFNIPNLTYTEDDMRFEQPSSFRLPTAYEIDDALATIRQMGGRVARTYVLSVRKKSDPPGIPRHILAPDQLNEEAMALLDRALDLANRHGARLIIPFIDQNNWWGGIEDFAGFRGKSRDAFFTDAQVKADFKKLLQLIVGRTNTLTGVRYAEDKAILAWELGNELKAPKDWVCEMAAHLKALDANHLVAESYFTDPDNPGVDIVQDHLYQGDPVRMLEQIRSSVARNAGRKVYLVGEFGFISTEGTRAIIDEIIADPAIAGGLLWSLRFHNEDGGYYWHHEPLGGDFFKAYHWPGGLAGEAYDEVRFMAMVRRKAFEIQQLSPPPLTIPAPPERLTVTDSGVVNWRGATGASTYELQRREKARGDWRTIADQLADDATQYHPLAVDESAEPGRVYYYRLLARNSGGLSKPSAIAGPVSIRCRALVDELSNLSRVYRHGGALELRSNDARNYKEDCHRLLGQPGAWVAYHVTGKIMGVKIYAFGEQGEPGLELRAGHEGGEGVIFDAQTQDFFAGQDMYNFRHPRLYRLGPASGGGSDLLIRFTSATQIGRIEIEYR